MPALALGAWLASFWGHAPNARQRSHRGEIRTAMPETLVGFRVLRTLGVDVPGLRLGLELSGVWLAILLALVPGWRYRSGRGVKAVQETPSR